MNRLEQIRQITDTILTHQSDPIERRCGFVHLYGVSATATLLAQKRGLNTELCAIAGMLHDISSYKTAYTVDHPHLSAIEAKNIMTELNIFTQEEIHTICTAISNHSSKQTIDTPYDELLKDADVLQHYLYNTDFQVKANEQDRLNALFKELGIHPNPPQNKKE